MKTKKVWLIEEGSYSDYCVVGVFSSKKNAEEVAKARGRDECSVNEWPLNPGLDNLRKGYWVFEVLMLRDGKAEEVNRRDRIYSLEPNRPFIWHRSQIPKSITRFNGKEDCLRAEVWARNEKHAIKIVNEIRTRMIAKGEWK